MNGTAFGAGAGECRLHVVTWALASAVCGVAAMRGWLCDDAYITLRVVDNLANGHGAVWNVAERVHVYTHPLWMLALTLAHFVTREFFLGPILLGVALTTATIVVLVRRLAFPTLETAAALFALLFSRAFVDYSTSGLENPLSHLIVVVFFVQVFTGRASTRWLGPADTILDVKQRTVLPVLMDLHVHLQLSFGPQIYLERFQFNPEDGVLLAAHHARLTLRAGFTTVRDLGGEQVVALRNAIAKGVSRRARASSRQAGRSR